MKKRLLVYVAALLVVAVMGACTVANSPANTVNNGGKISSAIVPLNLPESLDPETELDEWAERRENTSLDAAFIDSMDKFSYATAARILAVAEKSNVNYSPTSLYYALAVAALGAEGETQQELLDILGVSDIDYLAENCKNLFTLSYVTEKTASMTISNSFWVDDSLSIKDDFAKRAAENFFTTSHYGDFQSAELPKQMTDWVSENTNGLLKPQFNLSSDQVFSIINTLYFASEWIDRFYEENNTEGDFTLEDGSKVNVEYMNSMQMAGFNRGENFTRCHMNLKKGHMFFVLPDEGVSVKELFADENTLTEACSGGEEKYGTVTWQIPKFSFESEMNLSDTVKALGAETMFSDKADFSGICDAPIFVSDIRQGSKIAIDEKGVEAAAYTEILYCGAALPTDEAYMILDRPFIYGIRDDNGNILFMGVCGNPAEN